jgi:UDP-glucose 4-epimerase
LRATATSYREGARAKCVKCLKAIVEIVDEAPFGLDRFMGLAKLGGYDLFRHPAARFGGHKSPVFDIAGALAENTANLRAVLTGSVFEEGEGAGEVPLAAFSPLRPVEGPDRGGRRPPRP